MRADTPLTCKEIVELVTDYLEGSLPDEQRALFEAHLAACRGCRTYLEQMRQTIALTGRLTEEWLTPEAEQVLLNAYKDWKNMPEG
jgi:anti-sigma factor RsiW